MSDELRELVELLIKRVGGDELCRILRELEEYTDGYTDRQLKEVAPNLIVCGVDEIDGG